VNAVAAASTDSDAAGSGPSQSRQPISYCPYCAEETLFPIDAGGWECRSCLRAFSVKFLGLRSGGE
jgi:transposase-like protein